MADPLASLHVVPLSDEEHKALIIADLARIDAHYRGEELDPEPTAEHLREALSALSGQPPERRAHSIELLGKYLRAAYYEPDAWLGELRRTVLE